MKARICIYALILAAGLLTALAQETNTPAGGNTNMITAGPSEAVVPPQPPPAPAPAPTPAHKPKLPPVAPLTHTNAVAAETNIMAAPMAASNTSTSAPAVSEEESLTPTNAAPAQTEATPGESSGISGKMILVIGAAVLVAVGGLAVFLLRRPGKGDHASLITCAMKESKDDDKDAH